MTIGKTNTPELGMNASAAPVLTGPPHNPWKLGLVAGIVSMAHANDGGGRHIPPPLAAT